jgi:Flp pilus assembly protein TadD
MNLGFATFRAGRPPESRAAFEQALRRNPDDPTILLNLGVVAATQRDWARVEEVRASLARTGADRVDELDRRVRRFRPGSPPLK